MRNLKIGDRIRISGGFDMSPRWLSGRTHIMAEVIAFIPGQNKEPAAVVRLEFPITVESYTGDIAVLELRYEEATWKETETVHLELCDFMPESRTWSQRKQGKWIESHATYQAA